MGLVSQWIELRLFKWLNFTLWIVFKLAKLFTLSGWITLTKILLKHPRHHHHLYSHHKPEKGSALGSILQIRTAILLLIFFCFLSDCWLSKMVCCSCYVIYCQERKAAHISSLIMLTTSQKVGSLCLYLNYILAYKMRSIFRYSMVK